MLTNLLLLVAAQAPEPTRVSLVFGGDVIPHGPVKVAARLHDRRDEEDGTSFNSSGWDHVFGPLSTVFKRHDLAVVNLESPVLPGRPAFSEPSRFFAQPALLDGLKRAGVTVATFANNHCLDQDTSGIASTRRALDAAQLLAVGADVNEAAAWRPLVVEKKGLRIGLIAVTRWLNARHNSTDRSAPHVPVVPYTGDTITGGRPTRALVALVRRTAPKVDALFVTVHWGAEYKERPMVSDRRLARVLVEAGATAVIGHHPHVLQPVEWVTRSDGSRGLVAYSLGNLVSNQDFDDASGRKRDGVLLELLLERAADGKTELGTAHGVPIATENRRGAGKVRNVQPILLDEEVSAVEERLGLLARRDDTEAKEEQRALVRRLALLKQRLQRINLILSPAAVVAGRGAAPRQSRSPGGGVGTQP